MSDFQRDIDLAIKRLLELDDLSETNVTGNIDGGEGPPSTPNAFKSGDGTDEDEEPDHDSIEVFDYKKAQKTNKHFVADSVFKKMALDMVHINEAKYRDYRKDDTDTPKGKINNAIKEINTKLFELERTISQNIRLKQEMGVNNNQYWKSTKLKLEKIDGRLNKLSNMTRKFYE